VRVLFTDELPHVTSVLLIRTVDYELRADITIRTDVATITDYSEVIIQRSGMLVFSMTCSNTGCSVMTDDVIGQVMNLNKTIIKTSFRTYISRRIIIVFLMPIQLQILYIFHFSESYTSRNIIVTLYLVSRILIWDSRKKNWIPQTVMDNHIRIKNCVTLFLFCHVAK